MNAIYNQDTATMTVGSPSAAHRYGVVIADGVSYVLTQAAYIADNGEYYIASAIKDGDDAPEYFVRWEILPSDGEDREPEDDCDWSQWELIAV